MKFALAFLLLAAPAMAQEGAKCKPRSELIALIGGPKIMEVPQLGMTTTDGDVMFEVWANKTTGTWTIFMQPADPAEPACMMGSGTGFFDTFHEPKGDPS